MSWQDVAITIANLMLSCSLLPQIYKGFKNKKGYITLQTCLITTISLYIMAFTFSTTTDFLLTSSIMSFNSTMWTWLLIQTLFYPEA